VQPEPPPKPLRSEVELQLLHPQLVADKSLMKKPPKDILGMVYYMWLCLYMFPVFLRYFWEIKSIYR